MGLIFPKKTIPQVVISLTTWQNFRKSFQGIKKVGEYVASDLATSGEEAANSKTDLDQKSNCSGAGDRAHTARCHRSNSWAKQFSVSH